MSYINGTKIVVYDTTYLKEHKEDISGRLPSTYQEVEYIQSSGEQYIDMGIKANFNSKVILDIQVLNTLEYYRIFGDRFGSNDQAFVIGFATSNVYFAHFDSEVRTNINEVAIDTVRHKHTLSKDGYYIDNTLIGITPNATSFTTPNNLLICSFKSPSTTVNSAPMKIYSCKLYDNGVLVRDMYPCYRKSDNVVGLYDLVNGIFYTNSGTGTFIKGGKIMVLLELNGIYINLDSITQVYTTVDVIDNTKIRYFIALNNGSKLEISKNDYDTITEAYSNEG